MMGYYWRNKVKKLAEENGLAFVYVHPVPPNLRSDAYVEVIDKNRRFAANDDTTATLYGAHDIYCAPDWQYAYLVLVDLIAEGFYTVEDAA